jgi:hypothetical protein
MKARKAVTQSESEPDEDGGEFRRVEINARDGGVAAYHVDKQYLLVPASAPAATLAIKPEVIGAARRFTHSDDLLEAWAAFNDKKELAREREARSRAAEEENRTRAAAKSAETGRLPHHDLLASSAIMDKLVQQWSSPGPRPTPPKPSRPRSDDEVRAAMQRYRDQLLGCWSDCLDYLASVAWPALHFGFNNEALPILNKIEVILTFNGASGLECVAPEDVRWQKLTDPSWQPPLRGPFGTLPAPPLKVGHLAGYPVKWRNEGDDLAVTVNLPELRAHPPKELNGNDIVLIVRDNAVNAVPVTWTATAEGYDGYLEGEPFEVPIEEVDARDSTQAAFDAAADR